MDWHHMTVAQVAEAIQAGELDATTPLYAVVDDELTADSPAVGGARSCHVEVIPAGEVQIPGCYVAGTEEAAMVSGAERQNAEYRAQ